MLSIVNWFDLKQSTMLCTQKAKQVYVFRYTGDITALRDWMQEKDPNHQIGLVSRAQSFSFLSKPYEWYRPGSWLVYDGKEFLILTEEEFKQNYDMPHFCKPETFNTSFYQPLNTNRS